MKKRLESEGEQAIFALLALANSAWIYYAYLTIANIGGLQRASLARIMEGTAERPYVYRALVPFLAELFSTLIPAGTIDWLSSAPPAIRETFHRLSAGGYAREAAFVLVLMFLSLAAFAFAEKAFLADLGMGRKEQFILPLFAQMLILPLTVFFGYYYDLPQILLVTLGLVFLERGNWKGYLPVFAIASLNKETSFLLVAVYLIHYRRRLPRRLYFELLAWQAGIFALIRASLLYTFRNNAGSTAFLTLREHYIQYTAYPSTLVFTLVFFGMFGFLILRGWRRKHAFLRAASVIPVVLLVLFFTSGRAMEFRVFLDALPVLAILIFPPLQQQEPRSEPQQSIDKPSRTA